MIVRPLFSGAHPIGFNNATGQTLESLYAPELRARTTSVTTLPGSGLTGAEFQLPRKATPATSALIAAKGAAAAARALSQTALRASGDPHGLADPESEGAKGDLRLARMVRACADLGPVVLPGALVRNVARSQPTVIHSLLGNAQQARLALALAERLDLPIVPHFMDDWPTTIYRRGELGGAARRGMIALLNRIIERSPVILTVGSMMAAELSDRFDRPAAVAGNGFERSTPRVPYQVRADGARALVYVGGLHLGRFRVLQDVARELKARNSRWTVRVHCAAGELPSPQAQDYIQFAGPLAPHEVQTTLDAADALLFVESFEAQILDYTRLSVSTKVPQYLAANRPIVIVGPREQASVQALLTNSSETLAIHSLQAADADLLARALQCAPVDDIIRHRPEAFSQVAMRASFEFALRTASERGRHKKRAGS